MFYPSIDERAAAARTENVKNVEAGLGEELFEVRGSHRKFAKQPTRWTF
jgi:hypothetical protein